MLFQILAVAFGAISGAVLMFSSQIKMWFKARRRKGSEEAVEEVEVVEETEE